MASTPVTWRARSSTDSALAKLASDRGWQVMRFDRLGRNLALGATVGAVMLAAGLTVWLQDKE